MVKFVNTERTIIELFSKTRTFCFEGKQYSVKIVGKPRPSTGECKTDVYVAAVDESGYKREIKISVKQSNADFLENKISLERAKEILGIEAQNIIYTGVKSIVDAFTDDYLIYIDKKGKSEAKTIKLGWKFEFLNKLSGKKSAILPLTENQKIDIFSGRGLPIEKRNCKVGNDVICNSGVADYILVIDGHSNNLTIENCLQCLVAVEDYIKNQNIYFACKALNYRCRIKEGKNVDKWDGDRPLAVYVDWSIKGGKLSASLIFDNPLSKKGNSVGNQLKQHLKTLNISANNFADIINYIPGNVNVYKKEIK